MAHHRLCIFVASWKKSFFENSIVEWFVPIFFAIFSINWLSKFLSIDFTQYEFILFLRTLLKNVTIDEFIPPDNKVPF